MEKLIESITNFLYCMNSLLNSTGTQTLKTGVAEYSWLTQHLWVDFKSINFSCKTMLILVHVVFGSMLMAVLVLLQKSTFLNYYRWLNTLLLCMYTCTFYTKQSLDCVRTCNCKTTQLSSVFIIHFLKQTLGSFAR